MIRRLVLKLFRKDIDAQANERAKHVTAAAKKQSAQRQEATAIAIKANEEIAEKNTALAKALSESESRCKMLQTQVARMREKYPSIWLGGDVAQGCVQLPRLKVACEFFREENKFCIFVPWEQAAGAKAEDFVPEWLEVDDTLPITSIIDKMGSKQDGILFKIPIKDWADVYEAAAADSHPSYGLDGRAVEKTKSFRCKAGVNGLFRRECDSADRLYIHLYFTEFDLGNAHRLNQNTVRDYLPVGGNMDFDESRINEWQSKVLGEKPDRLFYWRLPMKHVDKPKLGYDRRTYIAPTPVFQKPETKLIWGPQ